MPFHEDNPVGQARLQAFLQALRQLGWADDRNFRIPTRWGAGDTDLTRKYAAELVALGPDVVMAFTSGAVAPLRQLTRTIPIVFAVVADPVGAGYVESLARPGGNLRLYRPGICPQREMAGAPERDCASGDTSGGPPGFFHSRGTGQFGAIQALAPSLGVELRPIDLHDS